MSLNEIKTAPNNCCNDKTNSLDCKLEWACRIFVDCAKKLIVAIRKVMPPIYGSSYFNLCVK
jgi:hypothetical protein